MKKQVSGLPICACSATAETVTSNYGSNARTEFQMLTTGFCVELAGGMVGQLDFFLFEF